MNTIKNNQDVPVFSLEHDPVMKGKLFSIKQFEGVRPHQSELLVPHRKDYYLFVFARRGGARFWADMASYETKDNTFYLMGPNQVIVKEEPKCMWGTALAFDKQFLALHDNDSLARLPIVRNEQNANELILSEADITFTEDMLAKILKEYSEPGEWQQRMITAYLMLLLTYLSRLYSEQYENFTPANDKSLLKKYQTAIEENFREIHQVSEYAALLYVSPGHLRDVIKAQSGKPAIAHIQERMVLEARRMLFHTEYSLKEIGFDLGFSDASYFSRFFKRETGVTPAEYRALTREMYQ
ncbi:helix-turn-helix domain-containing protein [Dyadobacter psychrotolerans]|uniref:AraC family transcriptional regulator n=1 Tax=Dyadobacter psychrotolerans TaxID=2541721 RepID=A0A4R5DMQ2_9BACT|nr:helix-turn-helix domain-containing protein [Dyadobacter psychrotolerans]TDE14797.1 AraC family transcriptional regulator [Dyadobacter psychrotolerans]